MAPKQLLSTPAFCRQNLLVEFSGLKTASPQGLFVSLTPGDPTLWSGVIFVRKGPYAPAILRFRISFPPLYPTSPPVVTFSTDIFHPLLTPLSTQIYATDSQDTGTVSTTDDERLPPGGFSLRHGFPLWFGRERRTANSRQASGHQIQTPERAPGMSVGGRQTPDSGASTSPTIAVVSSRTEQVSTYEVLHYIKSTFDDEDVLDAVPLEAAGNPGAWHAWRTHRAKEGKGVPAVPPKTAIFPWHEGLNDNSRTVLEDSMTSAHHSPARKAGEWNWDGVWEVRSQRGIKGSLAEPMLYGSSASDDLIKFLDVNQGQLQSFETDMIKSLEPI